MIGRFNGLSQADFGISPILTQIAGYAFVEEGGYVRRRAGLQSEVFLERDHEGIDASGEGEGITGTVGCSIGYLFLEVFVKGIFHVA